MDQKKKNTKLMIIIAIAVVVVIIGIIGAIALTNGNKGTSQTTEELTGEEQFAVDYLVKFSNGNIFNNRYTIKVHKVWYTGSLGLHIAYNITYQNKDGIEIEETVGSRFGLDVDLYKVVREADKKTTVYNAEEVRQAIEEAYEKQPIVNWNNVRSNYWTTDNLEAVRSGKQLDADKIQKAFEKAL